MFNICLKDKVAVITGASKGIGKAIAEVFAKNGAEVVLLSRNEDNLKENTNAINKNGGKARHIVVDISSPEGVEKAFSNIPKVDILINNAGICFVDSIVEMEIAKWQELLNINLNGAMYCTKYALPKMIEQKYGRIINISSDSGKRGHAYASAYCASKFALIGFTQSTFNEVAKHNITANAICPGWTETEMAEDILSDEKYAFYQGLPKDKVKEYSLLGVPIERYIKPEEVANLALYLASDYASAIGGQAINICGGLTTT